MTNICITGISGQTGSFLCEKLLNENHKVFGMIRKSSTFNTERIDHLLSHPNLKLIYGDITDQMSIINFIEESKPELFFNLAGLSQVRTSFDLPIVAMDVNGLGVMRCLEAIRKINPKIRFLQASTSELYGDVDQVPQNEKTPFKPRSPYAIGKLAGFTSVVNYREAYNIHASSSISFNHESYRRSPVFVSSKITKTLCEIKYGLTEKLKLGNISARRDWSHAKDISRAMCMIINADKPDDFVVASGKSHSVEDFLNIVGEKLNLDWKKYVEFDPRLLRPTEVPHLEGDYSKIKNELGWSPEISFEQLVDEMVEYNLKLAQNKVK